MASSHLAGDVRGAVAKQTSRNVWSGILLMKGKAGIARPSLLRSDTRPAG